MKKVGLCMDCGKVLSKTKYLRCVMCRGKHFSNENANGWKGSDVGYKGLHQWVRRKLNKPSVCVDCKEREPYDVANISQKYKRTLSDWEWLCRLCHMTKDGRMDKAHATKNYRELIRNEKGQWTGLNTRIL